MIPWHTVCVDLIGTHTVLAKGIQPDNKILTKELQLLLMTFIYPEMGWFKISEFPIIDQCSAIISQIFNEVWLSRYLMSLKVIFNNRSELKSNFI